MKHQKHSCSFAFLPTLFYQVFHLDEEECLEIHREHFLSYCMHFFIHFRNITPPPRYQLSVKTALKMRKIGHWEIYKNILTEKAGDRLLILFYFSTLCRYLFWSGPEDICNKENFSRQGRMLLSHSPWVEDFGEKILISSSFLILIK